MLFKFSIAHNVSGEERTTSANSDIGASPTKGQVETWVKQLATEDAPIREDAEKKLRDAGSAIDDWMVAPAKGLSGNAQRRVLEIFDHHLRVAHFDETVGKLNEKDWLFVQLRLDTLLVLLLEDRYL
ncbi:MAG: hypothetical protein IT514_16385 [Burkholderiales bacterium]|nr:hypothetical protein [Burkholderiales bacterium]